LDLCWSLGLVVRSWICTVAKGPSAPSNLNSSLWGFGLVVGSWTCSTVLDLQLDLGLVVRSWTCNWTLDL